MELSQLFYEYVNRDTGHKREVGKYWASELYSIIYGYSKPADHLKERKIDQTGMILTGIATEDMLTKVLKEMKVDFKEQVRLELKIKEMTLVVKPDFVFEDMVWETKHPFSDRWEKYKYQLEAEHRATKKKVYLGILSTPFDLRLIPYEPSDELWEEIKDRLYDFHLKVAKLNS